MPSEGMPFEAKRFMVTLAEKVGDMLLSSHPPMIQMRIVHLRRDKVFDVWMEESDLSGGVLIEASLLPEFIGQLDSDTLGLLEKKKESFVEVDGKRYFELVSLFGLEDQIEKIHTRRMKRLLKKTTVGEKKKK